MKTCLKCGRPFPPGGFYRASRGPDYRQPCKACYVEKTNAYARRPEVKARRRAICKTKPPRKSRPYGPAEARWASANLHKRRAYYAVAQARKKGQLVPQCCEKCGLEKAEAHHDDYAKALDVRWLCRHCHKEHHRLEQLNV